MADNAKWLLDQQPARGKTVLHGFCHFVLKTTLMRRPSRRTVIVTCGVA